MALDTKFKILGGTTANEIRSGTDVSGSISPIIFSGIDGEPKLAKISPLGELVIGVDDPDGPLHIAYTPSTLAIDQSSYNTSISGNIYQSFTAPFTGQLVKLTLRSTITPYSGIIEIRTGTGISGDLLTSETISLAIDTDTDISIQCWLENAAEYSICFTSATLSASNADPYVGGSSNIAGTDIFFKAHIRNEVTTPVDLLVVGDDTIDFTGKMEQNGITVYKINQDLDPDEEITIEEDTSGWGVINAGENLAHAKFIWNTNGDVTIIMSSIYVANTDTDNTLSIYNNGTNSMIKNNFINAVTIQAELCYAPVLSGGAAVPTAPTAPTGP